MAEMDELERRVVNELRGGFPLCARPFEAAARRLGTDEATLIARIAGLLERGVLTRFGPLYDVERMGGAFSLCALQVPAGDLERVAALVNAHAEVAHHYEREHRFNLWFVLAAPAPAGIARVLAEIERETGYPVMNLPRLEEYSVDLRLTA